MKMPRKTKSTVVENVVPMGNSQISPPTDAQKRKQELMLRVVGDLYTNEFVADMVSMFIGDSAPTGKGAADKSLMILYLYHFDRLTRCDEILGWLIKERITGRAFVGWVKENFVHNGAPSFLNAAKHIIRRIDLDVQNRPIYIGKDFN